MKEQNLESGIISEGGSGMEVFRIKPYRQKHNPLEFRAMQIITQTPAIENEISSFTEFLFLIVVQ